MASTVDDLLRLLELEDRGPGRYRGWTPPTKRQRIFGGQVAAQAAMAASLTVPRDHAALAARQLPALGGHHGLDRLRGRGRTGGPHLLHPAGAGHAG